MFKKRLLYFILFFVIIYLPETHVHAGDIITSTVDKDITIDIDESVIRDIIIRKLNSINRDNIKKGVKFWALDAYFLECYKDNDALDNEFPRIGINIDKQLGVWRCGRNDGNYYPYSKNPDDPVIKTENQGFNWIIDLDELMKFKDIYGCGIDIQNETESKKLCKKIFKELSENDSSQGYSFLRNIVSIRVNVEYEGIYQSIADVLVRVEIEKSKDGIYLKITPFPTQFYKTPYQFMNGKEDIKGTCGISSDCFGEIPSGDSDSCKSLFSTYLNVNHQVINVEQIHFIDWRSPFTYEFSLRGQINPFPLNKDSGIWHDSRWRNFSRFFSCTDLSSLDGMLSINLYNSINGMVFNALFPQTIKPSCYCGDFAEGNENRDQCQDGDGNPYRFDLPIPNKYYTEWGDDGKLKGRYQTDSSPSACDALDTFKWKDCYGDTFCGMQVQPTCHLSWYEESCWADEVKQLTPVIFPHIDNAFYSIQIINDPGRLGEDYSLMNTAIEPVIQQGFHFIRIGILLDARLAVINENSEDKRIVDTLSKKLPSFLKSATNENNVTIYKAVDSQDIAQTRLNNTTEAIGIGPQSYGNSELLEGNTDQNWIEIRISEHLLKIKALIELTNNNLGKRYLNLETKTFVFWPNYINYIKVFCKSEDSDYSPDPINNFDFQKGFVGIQVDFKNDSWIRDVDAFIVISYGIAANYIKSTQYTEILVDPGSAYESIYSHLKDDSYESIYKGTPNDDLLGGLKAVKAYIHSGKANETHEHPMVYKFISNSPNYFACNKFNNTDAAGPFKCKENYGASIPSAYLNYDCLNDYSDCDSDGIPKVFDLCPSIYSAKYFNKINDAYIGHNSGEIESDIFKEFKDHKFYCGSVDISSVDYCSTDNAMIDNVNNFKKLYITDAYDENSLQINSDNDKFGDECDNCKYAPNNDQSNSSAHCGSQKGDACNEDINKDGILKSIEERNNVQRAFTTSCSARDIYGRYIFPDSLKQCWPYAVDMNSPKKPFVKDVSFNNTKASNCKSSADIQDKQDKGCAEYDVNGICIKYLDFFICCDGCYCDYDEDGIPDIYDACPLVSNPPSTWSTFIKNEQTYNYWTQNKNDACMNFCGDDTDDQDGIGNGSDPTCDNCPSFYNPFQKNIGGVNLVTTYANNGATVTIGTKGDACEDFAEIQPFERYWSDFNAVTNQNANIFDVQNIAIPLWVYSGGLRSMPYKKNIIVQYCICSDQTGISVDCGNCDERHDSLTNDGWHYPYLTDQPSYNPNANIPVFENIEFVKYGEGNEHEQIPVFATWDKWNLPSSNVLPDSILNKTNFDNSVLLNEFNARTVKNIKLRFMFFSFPIQANNFEASILSSMDYGINWNGSHLLTLSHLPQMPVAIDLKDKIFGSPLKNKELWYIYLWQEKDPPRHDEGWFKAVYDPFTKSFFNGSVALPKGENNDGVGSLSNFSFAWGEKDGQRYEVVWGGKVGDNGPISSKLFINQPLMQAWIPTTIKTLHTTALGGNATLPGTVNSGIIYDAKNGFIYVFGGIPSGQANKINTSNNQAESSAPLEKLSTFVDPKIVSGEDTKYYIAGGIDSIKSIVSNEFYVFDTSTSLNAQELTPMPRPLAGHALAYNKNQNSVYVFGGSSDAAWSDPANLSPTLFNAIYEYKVDLGIWSELAPACENEFTCPPPSAGSVLIYNEFLNELSVVGGKKGRAGGELEQWYYSLNDNQWHVKQTSFDTNGTVCGSPREGMMCTQDDRTWWKPTGALQCNASTELTCSAANPDSDWFGFYFSFTKLNRFVINRNYAYMASNGGLQIATLAVDYLPVFAGWAPTDGAANDIIFDKNDDQYVYVADSKGIRIFDIDFTLWPDLENKVDVGEPVRGLSQSGTTLFAITAHSLMAFDISDPPRPKLISSLIVLDPELTDVDTDGKFVYLSGQTGLQVIDARNLSSMQTIHYAPMQKVVTHLRLEKNVLYTVNEINETSAFDVRSPSRPLTLGGHTASSWTKGIIVQGERASQLNGNWMNLRKLK